LRSSIRSVVCLLTTLVLSTGSYLHSETAGIDMQSVVRVLEKVDKTRGSFHTWLTPETRRTIIFLNIYGAQGDL
jgi:hypothetical protein